MKTKLFKTTCAALILSLFIQQTGLAQAVSALNLSNFISNFTKHPSVDKFRPLHLRYLNYNSESNSFKLLLDKGDFSVPLNDQKILKQEAQKLMQYFYIGLILPNEAFWVNLRPDSPDNIIDLDLAKTDLGKVLLEADLELKKDTANLTNPQTKEGKAYWARLYKKAEELFGLDNITIPTLTRPWIVPAEIIIRESKNNAYIYKATLKVMLESDYLKGISHQLSSFGKTDYSFKDPRLKVLNEYSSELIKELIIPVLTKKINTSKKYAPLRQAYYSLILAQWFKSKFRLGAPDNAYSDLIDSKRLRADLLSKIPWQKEIYFKAYQDSFNKGEYNIKEPINTIMGRSVRSYISGGVALQAMSEAQRPIVSESGIIPQNDYIAVPLEITNTGEVAELAENVNAALPDLGPNDPEIKLLKRSGDIYGAVNLKTGEIIIDIQESKAAFKDVAPGLGEESQYRVTGFVHAHELFHQLMTISAITLPSRKEERLADIFAKKTLGMPLEMTENEELEELEGRLTNDAVRVQLSLKYDSAEFLLNLHRTGVKILNIRSADVVTALLMDMDEQGLTGKIISEMSRTVDSGKDVSPDELKEKINQELRNQGLEQDIIRVIARPILFRSIVESHRDLGIFDVDEVLKKESALMLQSDADFVLAGEKIGTAVRYRPKTIIRQGNYEAGFGGDGFFREQIGSDQLFVGVIDVAGHDYYSAVIKTFVMRFIEKEVKNWRSETSPADSSQRLRNLAKKINSELRKIYELMDVEMGDGANFVCAEFALVDYSSGKIFYLSAGHNVLSFKNNDGSVSAFQIQERNMPLGMPHVAGFVDEVYEPLVKDVSSEEVLYLFSDGLYDAWAGQEASAKVTLDEIKENAIKTTARDASGLVREVSGHIHSGNDDFVIIGVDMRGKSSSRRDDTGEEAVKHNSPAGFKSFIQQITDLQSVTGLTDRQALMQHLERKLIDPARQNILIDKKWDALSVGQALAAVALSSSGVNLISGENYSVGWACGMIAQGIGGQAFQSYQEMIFDYERIVVGIRGLDHQGSGFDIHGYYENIDNLKGFVDRVDIRIGKELIKIREMIPAKRHWEQLNSQMQKASAQSSVLVKGNMEKWRQEILGIKTEIEALLLNLDEIIATHQYIEPHILEWLYELRINFLIVKERLDFALGKTSLRKMTLSQLKNEMDTRPEFAQLKGNILIEPGIEEAEIFVNPYLFFSLIVNMRYNSMFAQMSSRKTRISLSSDKKEIIVVYADEMVASRKKIAEYFESTGREFGFSSALLRDGYIPGEHSFFNLGTTSNKEKQAQGKGGLGGADIFHITRQLKSVLEFEPIGLSAQNPGDTGTTYRIHIPIVISGMSQSEDVPEATIKFLRRDNLIYGKVDLLTGEIVIDLELSRKAFSSVARDLVASNSYKITGFVHAHEIFHQLVHIEGVNLTIEQEEALADIFAKRVLGLNLTDKENNIFHDFRAGVKNGAIQQIFDLKYDSPDGKFLLCLQSLFKQQPAMSILNISTSQDIFLDLWMDLEKKGLIGILKEKLNNRDLATIDVKREVEAVLRSQGLEKDAIKGLLYPILFRLAVEKRGFLGYFGVEDIQKTENMMLSSQGEENFNLAGRRVSSAVKYFPSNVAESGEKRISFGGDGFFRIQIDGDKLLLGIIDAEGHDFYAAMVKAFTLRFIESEARKWRAQTGQAINGKHLISLITNLDQELKIIFGEIDADMGDGAKSVCIESVLIDYTKGKLYYLPAGEDRLTLEGEDGGIVSARTKRGGKALGISIPGVPDEEYTYRTVGIENMSGLYLFSDGLLEAQTKSAEKTSNLTLRRINDRVRTAQEKTPLGLINAITDSMFPGGDDIVVMAVELSRPHISATGKAVHGAFIEAEEDTVVKQYLFDGERKSEAFFSGEAEAALMLTGDNLKAIEEAVTRRHEAKENERAVYVDLPSPIIIDGRRVTKVYLKGVKIHIDEKSGIILSHSQDGSLGYDSYPMSVDAKGGIYSVPDPSPEGGMLFNKAKNEFENHYFIVHNAFLMEGKISAAVPMGYGKFLNVPNYQGQVLGYVILGISEDMPDQRLGKLNPKLQGRVLRRLHDSGLTHPYLHPGNISGSSDGTVYIHDLDSAEIFDRDTYSEERIITSRLRDIVYAYRKIVGAFLEWGLQEQYANWPGFYDFLDAYFEDFIENKNDGALVTDRSYFRSSLIQEEARRLAQALFTGTSRKTWSYEEIKNGSIFINGLIKNNIRTSLESQVNVTGWGGGWFTKQLWGVETLINSGRIDEARRELGRAGRLIFELQAAVDAAGNNDAARMQAFDDFEAKYGIDVVDDIASDLGPARARLKLLEARINGSGAQNPVVASQVTGSATNNLGEEHYRKISKKLTGEEIIDNAVGGGGGVKVFLSKFKGTAKFLPTASLTKNDLPQDYGTSLRSSTVHKNFPQNIGDITLMEDVKLTDVLLVSRIHNGMSGVARLGYLSNGRPVAVRFLYLTRIDEMSLLKDCQGAQIADELGIGPRFYGLSKDEFGNYGMVMDIVIGDHPVLGSGNVNMQTFHDLREVLNRLISWAGGVDNLALEEDFQYFVSNEGRLMLIDQGSLIVDSSEAAAGRADVIEILRFLNKVNYYLQEEILTEILNQEPKLFELLWQESKKRFTNLEPVFEDSLNIHERDGGSSPRLLGKSGPGGIDFRYLPIIIQPAINNLTNGLNPEQFKRLSKMDIEKELIQINNMVNAGILPSAERIKDVVLASYQRKALNKNNNKLLSCVASILRLEEENLALTDETTKEILILVEYIQ